MKIRIGLSSLLFQTVFMAFAMGCGLDWQVPKNHFDGVDEGGHVSYWQQIGTIPLGEGLDLPLIINFNSGRQSSSSYLGQGWMVALLESHIEPLNQQQFKMVEPDGLNLYFYQAQPTSTILEGDGGWKAEIKGDTFTAWASCGWKLSFQKGKLMTMSTPQGREFKYLYEKGVVTDIQEQGKSIFKVEKDPQTGQVTGFSFDGKLVKITLGDKPQISSVQGKLVQGDSSTSLNSISLIDGTIKTYKYGLDPKLQPTFKAGEAGHLFVWNAETGLITKDADWSYQIKAAKGVWAYAEMERTNRQGQKESWFYDEVHGKETTQTIDGRKTVKTWFTSGILSGKGRAIVFTDNNGEREFKATYNELGKLIKIIDSVYGEKTF